MVTTSSPTATVSSMRLVLSSCLLLLQLQVCRGFLVPALSSPPTLGAADIAIRPARVSVEEAEHVGGTTASSSGHDDSAVSGPGPPLVLTAFQEFVERRKSGAQRVVLDLRPGEDFRWRHLQGSTSIPIDELAPRLLELPPPFGQPVSIVGTEEVRAFCGESCVHAAGRVMMLLLCLSRNGPFAYAELHV